MADRWGMLRRTAVTNPDTLKPSCLYSLSMRREKSGNFRVKMGNFGDIITNSQQPWNFCGILGFKSVLENI
jgi:hypothetical protein